DVGAHLVDLLQVVGELGAVHLDASLLVRLEPVDAANECRFSRAGWPAYDDALAARHGEVDVLQYMELAVPLVQALDDDGRCFVAHGRCGFANGCFGLAHVMDSGVSAGGRARNRAPASGCTSTSRSSRSSR